MVMMVINNINRIIVYNDSGVICRSERARAGPTRHGVIKSFCRQKGHGFIIPRNDEEPIFVHISEWVGYCTLAEMPTLPLLAGFSHFYVTIPPFRVGCMYSHFSQLAPACYHHHISLRLNGSTYKRSDSNNEHAQRTWTECAHIL